MNFDVRELLGHDVVADLENLAKIDSGLGVWDVIIDVAVIFLVVAVATWVAQPWFTVLSMLYIGVRQRHLSNLGHELTHAKLVADLRNTQALGNGVMFILGEPFGPYRKSHWRHHVRLGKDGDPMLESYRAGHALEPRSSRLSYLWFVYLRSVLWRLPVEAVRRWLERGEAESTASQILRVTVWSVLTGVAVIAGFGDILLIYWILPLIFFRPAATWLTDLGNHAGLIQNENPLLQTRGWTSTWLVRHLFGGHLDDMYHPVHHFFPRIPYRRLPEAEAILRARAPAWRQVPWCSGFFVRRKSTPDVPCVFEDIVARVQANAVVGSAS